MSSDQDIKINTLENNYNYMAEKIDNLTKTVEKGFKDIKDQIEGFDKKYASKTTETIVYGMVGAILLAVLSSIIFLVIK